MKVIDETNSSLIEWLGKNPDSQWLSALPSFTGKEHTEAVLHQGEYICIQLEECSYAPAFFLREVWKKFILPYENMLPTILSKYNALQCAIWTSQKSWLTPLPANPNDRQFSTNIEKILRIANDTVTLLLELRRNIPALQIPWIFKVNISHLDKISMIFLQRLIYRSKNIPVAYDTYYFFQEPTEFKEGNVDQLVNLRVQDFYRSIGVYTLHTIEKNNHDYRKSFNRMTVPLEEALVWCEGYSVLAYANKLLQEAETTDEEADALILMMRAYLFERQLSYAEYTLKKVIEGIQYSNIVKARACIYYALLLANHIKQPDHALNIVVQGKSFLKHETGEEANREMGWLYNVEALIYYRLNILKQAIKALQQVAIYIKRVGEPDAILLSSAYTQNSSYLYEAVGKIDKAIETQQIFINKSDGVDNSLIMHHLFRIAFLKGELGYYQVAEQLFDRLYKTLQKTGDYYMQEWVSRSAAYMWLKAEQRTKAMIWLERCRIACEKIEFLPTWIGIRITQIAMSKKPETWNEQLLALDQIEIAENSAGILEGKKQLEKYAEGKIELYQLLPKTNSRFFYPFHKFWF